ncbi:MAG: prepilin-type N-terminal cleavage/methylation domain-containing protein, partial [Candidatus Moraniibacteriota bacterium]
MSKKYRRKQKKSGFTLIEALVGVFLLAILSLGIYSAYAFGIKLSVHNRLRTEAAAVAEKKLEAVRAMKYMDIGVAGGIPNGPLIATETETDNGTVYTIKTSVRYIDDSLDNIFPQDTDPTDYKQVEVKVSWPTNLEDKNVILNTLISPPRRESSMGTGVLMINTVDSQGTPLVGIQIHIVNNSVNPAIDLTEETDNNGSLSLPGVPAEDNYEITVSKNDYETVKTYPSYPASPFNPIDSHLSISEGSITSKTFTIDPISHLNLTFKDIYGVIVPDLSFSLSGGRTIGTTVEAAPQPVFFYNESALKSNNEGLWNSPDLGKGPYSFTFTHPNLELITSIPTSPWPVSAGSTVEASTILGNNTENILVVTVQDPSEETSISGATVRLTDSLGVVFQETTTDINGIAYFPQIENPAKSLTPDEIYTIDVTAAGYNPGQKTETAHGLVRTR